MVPFLSQPIDPAESHAAKLSRGLSFGRFVAQHPHRKGDITDLLIGDLFRPELDETLELIKAAVQAHAATEAG